MAMHYLFQNKVLSDMTISAGVVVGLCMPKLKHVREVVDADGLVTRTENEFFVRTRTQPFISIALPVSPLLHLLTSAKDFRVLFALAQMAEFNTNTVLLVASRRQQVMLLAEVTSSQLSLSLRRLREAQIISGAKGEATIHASVMWKGDTATRNKLLETEAKLVQSYLQPNQ